MVDDTEPRDVDTGDGRVFLVDLREKQSRVRQITAGLPEPRLSADSDAEATRAHAARVVEALREREDVRGFFDAAK